MEGVMGMDPTLPWVRPRVATQVTISQFWGGLLRLSATEPECRVVPCLLGSSSGRVTFFRSTDR